MYSPDTPHTISQPLPVECPDCKSKSFIKERERKVKIDGRDCTEYTDENGYTHKHDESNRHITHYKCTAGHKWNEVTRQFCWCGWKQTMT